ncbi:hypothetical protein HX773_24500 [Pantoea sp. B9002]|uniref:hypothetical protein n=1 Tax=Pantoea sp. B9002 TaxID=2726979 RepID=UPI0015A04275|nr:hypothetical protein [Pantoea sp. B9002]NWA64062.1 hypothetical protein [Pantoea sp. B9002]
MMIKKKLIACMIVAGMGLTNINAQASGIPVVDLASIAQAIQSYQQQILDYDQLLEQTGLDTSQLNQLYTQYKQILINYDQMLREAEGLKDKVSKKDWVGFLTQTGLLDSRSPYRTASPGEVEKLGDWRTAMKQSEVLYGLNQDWDSYIDTIANVPYNNDSSERAKEYAAYNYRKAQMATYQQAQVNSIDEGLADIAERADQIDQRRMMLGDSDAVRTAQLQAEQNQLIIEQNMQIIRASNKNFELSNQVPNEYFANKAKAQSRNSAAINEAFSEPTVVSDKALGDF